MILGLDHVNLRTTRLQDMVDWYGRVLGLHPGPRPDFGMNGAWLYAGDTAIVHLVEVASAGGATPDTLTMEHFALTADGMAAFLERLRAEGVPCQIAAVPPGVVDLVQVNIHDPDGNHIHVDFPAAQGRDIGVI